MSSETVPDPDWNDEHGHDAVAALSQAGEHPLMYSFPQGAIFTFDRDLRYLSAGGHGLSDVGLSRGMLEGRTIFEVFAAETAGIIEPLYRAALDGTVTSYDVPYAGRVYLQRLAPVVDGAGTVVAGLGFTQDVTQERAAERGLRESEERNQLTFEHAPIGQAIVGLDGSWRQVNAALLRLLEYTEEQLVQLRFQDITHPDDLDLDLGCLQQVLAGEIAWYQIEKRYITASGRTVWVQLSVSLVRDDDGSPLYFISQIQDITDHKVETQALADLTAMLAHDLRNSAAVILGFAQNLQQDPAPDSTQARDHVSRIAGNARLMTDLLDNALTVSSLDAGLLRSTPRTVSIRETVHTVIAALDVTTIGTDTAALEDVAAWVDPLHLDQVLTNLLTNAVKYGGDSVTVATVQHDDRVRVVVTDDGPGIEPDFVPHMFDRFSRAPAARSGPKRGSGLGLAIVRDLLAANDASIRYAPRRLGGSVFTIDLPAAGTASFG